MSNASPLLGEWHYRSFLNQKAVEIFGEGVIWITQADAAGLKGTGTFGTPGEYDVEFTGFCGFGIPVTIHMRGIGTGTLNRGKWIYDYVGYLVPAWHQGVMQVPAIVGSVVRTQTYEDDGKQPQPAGVVASFIAVRAPVSKEKP